MINFGLRALGFLSPDDHHTLELSNVELEKGEDLQLRLSFDQRLGLTPILWSFETFHMKINFTHNPSNNLISEYLEIYGHVYPTTDSQDLLWNSRVRGILHSVQPKPISPRVLNR
jgi:hypothetical protein